ncbi:polysaccharide deacetylase family protein [Methanococcoides orientis]|nr:polysaccharide deacetylase family protein [Methanococcoides orientis]
MYSILKGNSEIWDQFSKKEEYSPIMLDARERFSYSNTIYKDVFNPNVSEYSVQNGFQVEYPDNKRFAVCLTHDIDEIYPPLKHTILSSAYCLKNLNLGELKRQTFWKIKDRRQSPYINFRRIMDLEDKYDAKSSFYFIATEKDPIRFRYNVEDVENELAFISDNGWEVGLHGGYYSYNDLDEILKEKQRIESVLGKNIIGYRNHYLRFKTPDSWELLSKAGFKYDTTFGYTDMVGFRNGMCHPFKPYNRNENKGIAILEIPLVVMDGTLFDVANSFEDAWGCVKQLIDIVEKYNGVITLLWHNNAFNCSFRTNWSNLYEKILKYCYEKGAWMASGEEICEWWNNL